MVTGPCRVSSKAMSMASRTPKHIPRWSAMRTSIFVLPVPCGGKFETCPTPRRSRSLVATPLLNDGFQMIQVTREGTLAGLGQAATRLGPTAPELLATGEEASTFPLLRSAADGA